MGGQIDGRSAEDANKLVQLAVEEFRAMMINNQNYNPLSATTSQPPTHLFPSAGISTRRCIFLLPSWLIPRRPVSTFRSSNGFNFSRSTMMMMMIILIILLINLYYSFRRPRRDATGDQRHYSAQPAGRSTNVPGMA